MSGAVPSTDIDARLAAQLAADDAVLLATAGLGIVAGLHACAGEAGAILIQRGHALDVGGSPLALIGMAGLRALEIGLADCCDESEMTAALPAVAAALFVAEPSAPGGLLDLPLFLWCAHQAGRPVLVHHRGPPAWTWLLDAGADLVGIDLQPILGEPGGLIAGRSALVADVRRQCVRAPMLLAPPSDLGARLLRRLPG